MDWDENIFCKLILDWVFRSQGAWSLEYFMVILSSTSICECGFLRTIEVIEFLKKIDRVD
jgi:hypothetical protein